MRRLLLLTALLFALPAQAVNIQWVEVGDPGNACDVQSEGCFGSVTNNYLISKYETTNVQYAEFLNAVAADDTYGLYHLHMNSHSDGGITRSGSSESYTYSVKSGFADKPVNYVNFYDALRFANWLRNGQLTGAQDNSTTEDGAYDLSLGTSVVRKVGATIFLTSEDEWYKAAYYDAMSTSYFDYATASNTTPHGEAPPGTNSASGSANYASAVGGPTDVGAYTYKPSQESLRHLRPGWKRPGVERGDPGCQQPRDAGRRLGQQSGLPRSIDSDQR